MGSSHDRPEPTFVSLARREYERDLQGLFTAGEEVEALLAHPGWTRVAQLVRSEADSLDRKLDSRPLDTIQDYAFDHGRRGALLAFPEAARAIVSHAASERDKQARKHERAAGSALEA